MVQGEAAKAFQVVARDAVAGLGFDDELHVAEYEVDLDPTREAPASEQGVFENLEVTHRRVAGDAALARDVREVHDLAVAEGGDVPEVGTGGSPRGDAVQSIMID
ncbi:hypothetical protein KJ059_14040 [Myxococcota bacterium]|nr:hypothetical protein [Myxococcota bacterium]